MSCLVQCTNDACKSIAPAVSRMITITESKILLSDRLLVRYILAVTTTSVVLQLISITKSINQFFNFYSSLCKKSYQAGSVDLPLKSDKKQFQIIISSVSCQSEKKSLFSRVLLNFQRFANNWCYGDSIFGNLCKGILFSFEKYKNILTMRMYSQRSMQ